MEFESLCKGAGLKEEDYCQHVTKYCSEEAEEFIESLEAYETGAWPAVCDKLLEFYPSEEEERHYMTKALKLFSAKQRNIGDMKAFDKFVRRFTVISRYLEKKMMLANRERDDLFFKGIKPSSLRRRLAEAMEQDTKWTDHSAPPGMNIVIESVKKYLKKDRYMIAETDDDDDFSSSLDEAEGDSSSSDEGNGRESYRYWKKESKASVPKKKQPSSSSKGVDPMEPKDEKSVSDPAVDDLTKRLECLTTITEALQKQQQLQKKPFFKSCYMCGEETTHGVKDCPETVTFIASGILKLNTDGRVVRANSGSLPRGVTDGGGIAKILKEEIKHHKGSASNIEVDKTYLVANYEFAQLDEGDTEYTVMLAERAERGTRKERVEPYDKSRLRSAGKGKEKAQPPKEKGKDKLLKEEQLPKVERPKAQVYVDVPPPPKVLQRDEWVPQNEDIEMADQTPTPIKEIAPPSVAPPAMRKVPFKPMPQGVRVKEDATPNKPKCASPAYKFSTTIQESIDYDMLVEKILDERISLSLREILSSYEVAKRMQSMTKSQKIPINGPENMKSAKTAGAYIRGVTDDEEGATCIRGNAPEARVFNMKVDLGPGCVHQASIHNMEAASDAEFVRVSSDEGYTDTEDEAESYYRAVHEEEYSMERQRESNLASARSPGHSPKFLAMVTARISGVISDSLMADMLINNGSELNIMTMDLQEKLELPVDLSGATWVLKGVSGHTVQLVGLCRNVPIGIGGLEFNHNFFVAQGSISDKQLILGQPWIYNHAACFDYIPPKGLQMQIWEHGDSVRITIPILNSPRNVFGASVKESRTRSWHSRVVELEATPGGPGLRLARPLSNA